MGGYRFGMGLALLVLLGAMTNSAVAQESELDREFSVERFRLASDHHGILDVESADVIKHLDYDLGLWLGYADDPLNLYQLDAIERRRVGSLVSHRLGGHLIGSLGVLDRLQLGLEVPLILSQAQNVDEQIGRSASLGSFGFGDLRLVSKFAIVNSAGDGHGINVGVLIRLTLPTSTSNDYFGSKSVVFAPELLVSKTFSRRVRAAANFGYRAQKRTMALNLEVNDEIFAHLGVAYMMTERLEVDATVSMATAASNIAGNFNQNFSEIRGGGALHLGQTIVFGAVGGGTSEGFGTPDWRILLGLRFSGSAHGRRPRAFESSTEVVADHNHTGTDGTGGIGADRDTSADTSAGTGTDSDGDGIADVGDKCPDSPEDLDNFEDDDGCPELDNDNDGIADASDRCALLPGDAENNGCPAPDRDGDSVADGSDNCPDLAGTIENLGCNEEQLVRLVGGKLELLEGVHFATNKALIRARSYRLLRNVSAVLNNHPELGRVEVKGHTDNRGSDSYNKLLSLRRAEAVVEFLKGQGVGPERLIPIGVGEDTPIATNDSDQGRATNRRVEFNVVGAARSEIQNIQSKPSR